MPTSITDFTTYKAMVANGANRRHDCRNTDVGIAGRPTSLWLTASFFGASPVAPTSAVALSSTSDGAIGQQDAGGSNNLRLVMAQLQGNQVGTWIIADRLCHQGGLSGTVTTAQTTNLPTAALTRYTNGVGVIGGYEIYTTIGVTPTTVTCSYTAAPSGAHTSLASIIGGTSFAEAGRILPINLAASDTGLTAVADVTVLASTGTAGNFGVTLFKPLMIFPVLPSWVCEYDPLVGLGGNIPIIQPGACLFWMNQGTTPTSTITTMTLGFADDQ